MNDRRFYHAVVATLTVAMFMLAVGFANVAASAAAVAPDTEYDIISTQIQLFVEEWEEGQSPAAYEKWVQDAEELWYDTESGTYCETYAALYYFWTSTMQAEASIEVNGPEHIPVYIASQILWNVVLDQFDAIGSRCENEL